MNTLWVLSKVGCRFLVPCALLVIKIGTIAKSSKQPDVADRSSSVRFKTKK